MTTKFKKFKKKALSNPAVRVEYERLGPEFEKVEHLNALIREAEDRAKRLGHSIRWRAAVNYRDARSGTCTTCGATILVLGDMSQAIRTDKPLNGRALLVRCSSVRASICEKCGRSYNSDS